jgi:hypothetical protein
MISGLIFDSGLGRSRLLIRRAFYSLSPGLQLRVKSVKRSMLRQYDWAEPIKQLRVREQNYLDETVLKNSTLPDRKRIAVYSVHHFSPVEYGLAIALRLRGHDVRGVLCDGLLPLCEMNLGPNIRPPCEACIMHLSRYEDAFGFNYARLTDFLSEKDRREAEQLVARTPNEGLLGLVVNRVRVGRLARRELQRYYRGFVFDPPRDPTFRRWLVSAVLLTWLSERWLERNQPDIVGVCSGRTLNTACVFEVGRLRGIHVVTWDGTASHPDGLMFSHNQSATEIPLDDAWMEASKRRLSTTEMKKLTEYLSRWARSEVTPFPYNLKPIDDPAMIRRELGLRPGAPTVVAFTNTSWDIAVIDRDVGFNSMFDWIFSLVEYAMTRPEIDFVVRAHPAEKNVPLELRSRTPVVTEIKKRFQPLPNNIRLIEGDNPISSYTLAAMAQVNMVYASRLGLELALRGMRPWIAGNVTYRDKGFTLDLISKEHMYRLLDAKLFDNQLSEEEVTLAQRFAYLWFFRYEVRLPLLRPPDKRFILSTFRELGPGGHPVLDKLCDAICNEEPFVDLNVPEPHVQSVPQALSTASALLHDREWAG